MLGQRHREQREKKGMHLREVSAPLEIDTAMIGKIERGEKRSKREHILKPSKELETSEHELTALRFSDSIYPIEKMKPMR